MLQQYKTKIKISNRQLTFKYHINGSLKRPEPSGTSGKGWHHTTLHRKLMFLKIIMCFYQSGRFNRGKKFPVILQSIFGEQKLFPFIKEIVSM